ncbi:MAG: hypothetical protein AB7V25_17425, partial [Mangrovibacterium sp.]
MKRIFLSIISLLVFEVVLLAVPGPETGGWKAGVATMSITPEKPWGRGGSAFRDKPAEGKLQDLWAKALVLEDA